MSWAPNQEEQDPARRRAMSIESLEGRSQENCRSTFPVGYHLTINRNAVEGLGLVLPPGFVAKADRVLE